MRMFLVKEEHLELLNNMCVDWNYNSFGAPTVDPKRPYGNSNVYEDIANILDIAIPFSEDKVRIMLSLHQDMKYVLQIIIQNLTIQKGIYILVNNKWNLKT